MRSDKEKGQISIDNGSEMYGLKGMKGMKGMRLTFVTGNPGKLKEVKTRLGEIGIEVVGRNAGYPEIQSDSLIEVVKFGAEYLAGRVPPPFVLDDSGLFIGALNGFPGVYSSFVFKTLGNTRILMLMKREEGRSAEFRTVMALMEKNGDLRIFEGKCAGRITREERGKGGFGYDPIFIPEGYDRTFAEVRTQEKNRISHRGRALEKLCEYLQKP